MTEPRPEVGEQVRYFEPSLLKKIGYGRGWGGRGIGPYVAIVTNDLGDGLTLFLLLPMTPGHCVEKIKHKDDAVNDQPYWDWIDPLQKARAVKRLPKEAA